MGDLGCKDKLSVFERFETVMKALGCPRHDAQGPLHMLSEKISARYENEHQAGTEENCREIEGKINEMRQYLQGLDPHCLPVPTESL
jgi:hypothetical protein